MKSSLWIAAALVACSVAPPATAADRKPNIIYIVADDLGWKDVGFNGCHRVSAPFRLNGCAPSL